MKMSVLLMGVVVALATVGNGQSQMVTPCSATMISSFAPCFNFVTNNNTGSANNGTTPNTDCCNSIKSLANTSVSCFCLIATGTVPFQLPVNRTLALALPRACNMPGIPFQCKAAAAPIPSPRPSQLGPSPSPVISPSANPQGSAGPSPSVFPGAGTPDTPPSSPPPPEADSGSPPSSTTPGSSTPSSANGLLSYSAAFTPSLLMIVYGFGV